jgi:hypothetical protein
LVTLGVSTFSIASARARALTWLASAAILAVIGTLTEDEGMCDAASVSTMVTFGMAHNCSTRSAVDASLKVKWTGGLGGIAR